MPDGDRLKAARQRNERWVTITLVVGVTGWLLRVGMEGSNGRFVLHNQPSFIGGREYTTSRYRTLIAEDVPVANQYLNVQLGLFPFEPFPIFHNQISTHIAESDGPIGSWWNAEWSGWDCRTRRSIHWVQIDMCRDLIGPRSTSVLARNFQLVIGWD